MAGTISRALTWDAKIGRDAEPAAAIKNERKDFQASLKAQVKEQTTPQLAEQKRDTDAEHALLGSMLLDPDLVIPFCIKKNVTTADLHDPEHRMLYSTMLKMHRSKKGVDILTVSRESGVSTLNLNPLLDATPTANHAEYYIDLIKASSDRQKFINAVLSSSIDATNKKEISVEELRTDLISSLDAISGKSEPVKAKPLKELIRPKSGEDPNELLKNRYLSRGGGVLLVAQTGVGKSSFVMQAAIMFALGREFFGVQPARQLRTLIVQAENDEGDMAEMRDGVIESLNLTPEEKEAALTRIYIVNDNSHTSHEFGDVLRGLLATIKPDLLIVDPASAYHGGDSGQQKDVTMFLRNIINPIITTAMCGLILVHHTNKPPKGDDRKSWTGGDWAYLGAGSAEWCNWARGIINIEAVKEIYRLRLAKRGKRVGWRSEDGEVALTRWIAHSKDPDLICWRDADPDEIPDPTSMKEPAPGRPAIPKLIDAYMPNAIELCEKGPIQVTEWESRMAQVIIDNMKLGRGDARTLKDVMTTGLNAKLATTKRVPQKKQFIGKPQDIQKMDQERKQVTMSI